MQASLLVPLGIGAAASLPAYGLSRIPAVRRLGRATASLATAGRVTVALLVAGFGALLTWLGIREMQAMHVALGDLALYDQMMWETLHGHLLGFTQDMDPPDMWLAHHFSPLLILLSPLSLLTPDPSFLVAIEAAAIALGALPIALYARSRLKHPAAAPLAVLAYFLNPVIWRSALLPFHEPLLAIAPLGFGLYFLLHERWRAMFFALIAALLVKDEIAFSVIGLGLYAFLVQRRRRIGGAVMALGAVWVGVALGIVVPRLNNGHAVYFMQDYAYLGASSPLGILSALVTRPQVALQHLFVEPKMAFLAFLLAPFGFLLPFAGWRFAWLATPTLAYLLLGDSAVRYDPFFAYYAAATLPFLYFAAVEGVAVIGRVIPRAVGLSFLTACAVASYATDTGGPGSLHFDPPSFSPSPRDRSIAATMLSIPPDLSLSATPNIMAYAGRRWDHRPFPELLMPTDVYAVDLQKWPNWGPYPQDFVRYDSALKRLLQDPSYTASYYGGGFLMVRRGVPPLPGHAVGADLGQRVELAGYDAPSDLHAGKQATFTLYWRALQRLDRTYTVFLHFGDNANEKVAQQDGWPWEGYFPTPEWAPGQTLWIRTCCACRQACPPANTPCGWAFTSPALAGQNHW